MVITIFTVSFINLQVDILPTNMLHEGFTIQQLAVGVIHVVFTDDHEHMVQPLEQYDIITNSFFFIIKTKTSKDIDHGCMESCISCFIFKCIFYRLRLHIDSYNYVFFIDYASALTPIIVFLIKIRI